MEHPVTEAFFSKVKEAREEALLRLASGQYAETPGRQNIAVGLVAALTKILDTQFQEDE